MAGQKKQKNWSDPMKWAMGIASALIVATVVALVGLLFRDATGVPPQSVPFVASSTEAFAIQSEFVGTAKARGDELSVEVDRAKISYRRRNHGFDGPRTIVDVRASLVEPHDGSWRPVRQSALHQIGREISPDGEIDLGPFRVTISLKGLASISHTCIVFDISETAPGQPTGGLSHAHTRTELFAD